ncbi:MAG: hypothetical protein HC915_11010 [Anaerolineae bacterium]|nr:hypothetical protein [Anaerolineae bacterium]
MDADFSQAWIERLRALGLDQVVAAWLEVAEPLTLLAAQLLWVAQPGLALWMDPAEVGRWAAALEDPQTLANWRAALQEGNPGDE